MPASHHVPRSRRSIGLAAASAIVPALLAAACSTTGDATATSGAVGAPTGDVIEVGASEYAFDPSSISVPAGDVTFRVTNAGTIEHEFELFEGDQVVDEVEGLVPGLTRDLTVTLEPGAYTFACKLTGHQEAGMAGTLTVTE